MRKVPSVNPIEGTYKEIVLEVALFPGPGPACSAEKQETKSLAGPGKKALLKV